MKIESWIFGAGVFFFVPVSVVYGFLTNWHEWVGTLGILAVARPLRNDRRLPRLHRRSASGLRPEDRNDAEIHEGAGEQGHFSPWSWWPLVLALPALAASSAWQSGGGSLFIAAGLAVVALVGWVFEYSRGDHAH